MAGWRGLLKILTPRLAYVAAAGVALSAAGAFAAGIFVLDQGTLKALEPAKTDAPPRLDGKADAEAWRAATAATARSEASRVGNVVGSPGRSRWSRLRQKNNTTYCHIYITIMS